MSHKVLILGGIRSGKSGYAESLLAGASSVQYVATSAVRAGDADFADRVAAHRFRRPASWATVDAEADPQTLPQTLREADPASAVLVDDLGGWVTQLLGRPEATQLITQLAEAVRACPAAKLVLVSPEVGLSVVPPTEVGMKFADLLGQLNQAIARECADVSLIVAGQAAKLKRSNDEEPAPVSAAPAPAAQPVLAPIVISSEGLPDAPEVLTPETPARPAAAETISTALTGSTGAVPIVGSGLMIQPGMQLPLPSEEAQEAARQRLMRLDLAGGGFGSLTPTILFAAGTQDREVPQAWRKPRLMLLHGDHEGGASAGDSVEGSARAAAQVRAGGGPIGLLAAEHGVSIQVVQTEPAGSFEHAQAATEDQVDLALRQGWQLVEQAVDAGTDLIIVGSCGAGAETAAAAVVAALTGAELAGLLARVVRADGTVDDAAWMLRCTAARDALNRLRGRSPMARVVLMELAGPDIAVATGMILGATARRTPVLLDGPVGVAAALLARDLGSQSRLWCTMADYGGHPTVKIGADTLGIKPLLDLKAGLGEGATALLALPTLRSALSLVESVEVLPRVLSSMTIPPGFEGSLDSPTGELPAVDLLPSEIPAHPTGDF